MTVKIGVTSYWSKLQDITASCMNEVMESAFTPYIWHSTQIKRSCQAAGTDSMFRPFNAHVQCLNALICTEFFFCFADHFKGLVNRRFNEMSSSIGLLAWHKDYFTSCSSPQATKPLSLTAVLFALLAISWICCTYMKVYMPFWSN